MRMTFMTAAIGTFAALVAISAAAEQKPAEIRVEATRIIDTPVGQTASGIKVRKFTTTYAVSLDDLDLSTSAGALTAEKRINSAALAACQEVGRQHPTGTPNDEACAKDAARPALAKLHEAIAAAYQAPAK